MPRDESTFALRDLSTESSSSSIYRGPSGVRSRSVCFGERVRVMSTCGTGSALPFRLVRSQWSKICLHYTLREEAIPLLNSAEAVFSESFAFARSALVFRSTNLSQNSKRPIPFRRNCVHSPRSMWVARSTFSSLDVGGSLHILLARCGWLAPHSPRSM